MENIKDYSHIKGWGIDADEKNNPTYPIKNRTNEEHKGYTWERPAQQPVNIKVLHSNERPNVSAVFGIASPPSGLSGMIRRFAFRYSENMYLHWLPLVLADKINVIEGIIDDIAHGKFPNIPAEKGMKAMWAYNKTGVFKNAAISAAVATTAIGGLVYAFNGKRILA